jgi:hypothetical protein
MFMSKERESEDALPERWSAKAAEELREQDRRQRGCLMHIERDILGGAFHESRSLLWSTDLRQLHGSSKGRALNMR